MKFTYAADNCFMLLLWWYPFKIQKEKLAGLQFTSTDYLSLVWTPLRIRWTVPLTMSHCISCITFLTCWLDSIVYSRLNMNQATRKVYVHFYSSFTAQEQIVLRWNAYTYYMQERVYTLTVYVDVEVSCDKSLRRNHLLLPFECICIFSTDIDETDIEKDFCKHAL
jgi:hypothetical protein